MINAKVIIRPGNAWAIALVAFVVCMKIYSCENKAESNNNILSVCINCATGQYLTGVNGSTPCTFKTYNSGTATCDCSFNKECRGDPEDLQWVEALTGTGTCSLSGCANYTLSDPESELVGTNGSQGCSS